MNVVAFLGYLHEHSATWVLAESLAQILVRQNRGDLVPAEIALSVPRRVAS